MVEELFWELSLFPEVEAIALGGSRVGHHYDEKSDYDVYVYCKSPISEESREALLSRYCKVMEIGNHFWELEDNCTLKNGIDIDILYRNLDDFLAGISEVVDKHQPHNGYTTCMWHNLCTCKILYDEEKRLERAKDKYKVPYPEELKTNIIERNMRLLRNSLPSYDMQIKKAVKRNDLVSINHRTAEFLASYFDVIFAVNERTHPGEKQLIELCKANCKYLPIDFEKNLQILFKDMFVSPEKMEADLNRIIKRLEKLLERVEKRQNLIK